MLEREQIIMKPKSGVGGAGGRGGKDWFYFPLHTSKKYCFRLDLPLLKNQHL